MIYLINTFSLLSSKMVRPSVFIDLALQRNLPQMQRVLIWVWFFLLIIMTLVWTTEYRMGYRRPHRKPVIPPLDYFTRPIEQFNNQNFGCIPSWESKVPLKIQGSQVDRMFDYSTRFMDSIFSQGIFTPPQNELNSCR